MTETPSLPRKLMLLTAVAQGAVLLFLYDSMESGIWPSQSPLWSFPLWTLAIAVPVLLLLSFERGNELRVAKLVGLFAIVLALVALYIGSQARPFGEFPLGSLIAIFACTMTLACFKALMYLQQRAARMPMSYAVLFTNSWRNFLTLALALIFTFVFWLILNLWAALFEVIGVSFFDDLFGMHWFLFPVLGLAHGLGVMIFRNLTGVIDSITRLLQGLIKLLLPLILMVAAGFIAALPFVGVDALWSTGRGTALLLCLLALLLFFTNGVYQDGRGEMPYPVAMHRMVYVCLLVMPVIAVLSFYGLSLRVGQYGLTVERCWAYVVWFILTLFATGYVVGILRRRDLWILELARVNTGMGIVVLAIMLLANSPLLDFRKLSLSSQLARVDAGEMGLENFDFWYAHRNLARPGYMAREEMKLQVADSDPDLLQRIEDPYPSGYNGRKPLTDWWARAVLRPTDLVVPRELRERIERENSVYDEMDAALVRADLDEDGEHEYTLVLLSGGYVLSAKIYYRSADDWASVDASAPGGRVEAAGNAIEAGEISLEKPRFMNLRIGDLVLRPATTERWPALRADPLTGIE